MTLSVETVRRLWASGRNYASLVLGFASGIGIVSAAQEKGLQDALNEITAGVAQIYHGASSAWVILLAIGGPILGPIIARWASRSATTESQAKAVVAAVVDPNTPITPETKAAITTAAAKV